MGAPRRAQRWEEADRARRAALARKEAGHPEGKMRLRKLLLAEYASRYWWAGHVALNVGPLTQLNYQQALTLIVEYFRGVRLEELSEETVDEFASWLKEKKTDKKTRRFARAVYLRTIDVLVRMLNHAVENRVLEHNPAALTRRRAHARKRGEAKVKPVRRREVVHPRTVERARLGVRGRGLEAVMFRVAIDLIAWEGFRPSAAIALRHHHWRDEHGPLARIEPEGAIKSIRGHLVEGETKTDTLHKPILWPAIAEELEELYQLQGVSALSARVLTNSGRARQLGQLAPAALVSRPSPGVAVGAHSFDEVLGVGEERDLADAGRDQVGQPFLVLRPRVLVTRR